MPLAKLNRGTADTRLGGEELRLTRSQRLTLLAVAVPGITYVAFAALYFAALLLGEPSSSDEEYLMALIGGGTFVVVTTVSLLVFGTWALVEAKPQSDWAQATRQTALCVLSGSFLLFGGLVTIATVAEARLLYLSMFAVCIPLGFQMLYVLAKEGDPNTNPGRFAKSILRALPFLVVGGAVVVGVQYASVSLGAEAPRQALQAVIFLSIALLVVPMLASIPLFLFVNPLLTWHARRRGDGKVALSVCSIASLGLRPVPLEQAAQEWEKVGRLPQGGRISSAWHSPAGVRLECLDARGERWVLLGGLESKPRPEWVAGLFFRASSVGPWDSKWTLGIRLFERVGCRWSRPPDDRAATERARLGSGVTNGAPVWVCQDCSCVRIDLTDTDGRDCMIVGDLPEELEPRWYAGLFLVFAKAPALASDTAVVQPEPV